MTQAQDFIRKIEHDGVTYTFGMPSAEKQRAVLFRLGKYGVEPLIRGLAQAELGAASSVAIAGQIVGVMLSRIPEDDFNFICDTMLGQMHKNGELQTINAFSGRLKTYFTLVVLALGNVFEDFTNLLIHFQSSTASRVEAAQDQENS
ncbi:phage tail assembly chaperone [Pseudomonas promysalinigenes]